DDGADAGEPLPEPPLLGLDLGDDVRAAVPRDVRVLFHWVRLSTMIAARATKARAVTVTTRKTTAPAWNVISPPHGAGTAAPPCTATAPTFTARIVRRAATTQATARRDSHPRHSDHGSAKRHGMTTRGIEPTNPQKIIV